MEYSIANDIQTLCLILGLSESQLADAIGVHRSTISRLLSGDIKPSPALLESLYDFAYSNPYRRIYLNELKTEFAIDGHQKILYHGSRKGIEGPLDLAHSRSSLDLGQGFYLGESYDQTATYVYTGNEASVYLFDASKLSSLKTLAFQVGLDWMLTVCLFRDRLKQYENHPILQGLRKNVEEADVVIAPIADNAMYEVMSMFAEGYITDIQAQHALSASNLGKQYALKSETALRCLTMVDRLYLAKGEKEELEKKREKAAVLAKDKIKIAIEKHRREGRYVEEIFQ